MTKITSSLRFDLDKVYDLSEESVGEYDTGTVARMMKNLTTLSKTVCSLGYPS